MERSWYIRCLFVVGVIAGAAYLLYPSYYYFAEASPQERDDHGKFCASLPTWTTCTKFNLGLDLQGGVHLVMGVGVDKAVEQRADRVADSLREAFKEEEFTFSAVERPKTNANIEVKFAQDVDLGKVEVFLRQDFAILESWRKGEQKLILSLTEEEQKFVRDTAVEQTIKTIRNRADKLGVTEPTIARRGKENVLIQLPGVKDPERAIDIIGRTAQLEFTIVETAASATLDSIDQSLLPPGVEKQEGRAQGAAGESTRDVYLTLAEYQREAVSAILEPALPNNIVVAYGVIEAGGTQQSPQDVKLRTYLLNARPGITGDYLTNATVAQNPDVPSDYYVTMTFDTKGAKIFEDLTANNVNRQMAIVLDDKVNSAPVIQERIGGGTARITLGSAGDTRARFQEAKDLSLVLKAGALPAPVEIREKRQVGKTLGQESVEKGSFAIIVGAILVVLFMLLYYRASGVVANIALVLNVFFVIAVLALFEATLTLPGMAGILLTIGMAVDANVIIFERVREELAIGKTPRAAIDAGYAKAFSTIVDANITTLIAGVVLMQYGTGPVRGFAVTLIVGIMCSMFTAIVVTRLIFDFFTGQRRLKTLSI
ncbi:MAG: protein translocase subunit SecD [Myxococcota bacterium]|nr:protein translocase subunit SecD [Myxococcota bacterium]